MNYAIIKKGISYINAKNSDITSTPIYTELKRINTADWHVKIIVIYYNLHLQLTSF